MKVVQRRHLNRGVYIETTTYTDPREAAMERIFADVRAERARQIAKFGDQRHLPNGTGPALIIESDRLHNAQEAADAARERCERLFAKGMGTYEAVLTEEYREALAETIPEKLREELVQVAAVAVAFIEKIDHDKERKA